MKNEDHRLIDGRQLGELRASNIVWSNSDTGPRVSSTLSLM